MPRTSCAVPRVRAHSVTSPGMPPDTMSTESEISAPFMASGPLKVIQDTFTSGKPSAAACFSSRRCRSMTLNCR